MHRSRHCFQGAKTSRLLYSHMVGAVWIHVSAPPTGSSGVRRSPDLFGRRFLARRDVARARHTVVHWPSNQRLPALESPPRGGFLLSNPPVCTTFASAISARSGTRNSANRQLHISPNVTAIHAQGAQVAHLDSDTLLTHCLDRAHANRLSLAHVPQTYMRNVGLWQSSQGAARSRR